MEQLQNVLDLEIRRKSKVSKYQCVTNQLLLILIAEFKQKAYQVMYIAVVLLEEHLKIFHQHTKLGTWPIALNLALCPKL